MRKKHRKIHVVGLNSFEFENLSFKIQNLFHKIENIAVPKSYSNELKSWISKESIENKNLFESKSDSNLIEWLRSIDDEVILISRGDPLWYGIGRILLKNFSHKEIFFYPSNTCIQQAFSKLKKSWQGTKVVSLHGRDSIDLVKCLKLKEKSIAILTDPQKQSLELIRNNLKELNLENCYEFWLLEELGSKKEKIRLILDEEELPKNIFDLNVVILFKKDNIHPNSSLPLFGINDNLYQTFEDRPNLITKREIRIQILADLELPEFGTLLDIGAGSGTIGLEALRIRPKIKLTCIDKRFGSQALIKENAKRLGVIPKKVIEGDVMNYINNEIIDTISNSNRIVIGGCNLQTKLLVVQTLTRFLKKDDIIILPIITFEVLQQVISKLKELNYETNINLIQTFKGLSIVEGTRFEPNNPIFIIKAKK